MRTFPPIQRLLEKQLELLGWKFDASPSHFGEEFDLVGSRRFLFTPWNVLVKFIDVQNDEEVRRWTASFQRISAESKKGWDERCFLLCLVASKVEIDPECLTEARDSFELFGVVRRVLFEAAVGGGNVFVVDLTDRTVHGTIPLLPYDVRKYSRDLQAMFQGMFASE